MGSKANMADKAKLLMEAGQELIPMEKLTDSGDHTKFTSSADHFSAKAGKAPEIYPQGLINGGAVTPAVSLTNDMVDGAALNAYIDGVKTAVGADTDLTCLRGLTTDTHRINSITVTDAGAFAVVSGVDGTAFSEVRGADGGPPLIPAGSIEVAQVRFTSITNAPVTEDEIFDVPGQHREEYNYPVWEEDNIDGSITFAAAQPLIHTGATAREVWAKVYDPIFAEVPLASDFVPPANSHSVGSSQVYNDTVGSSSSTLGQGSFKALLKDGITDLVVTEQDEELMFKFFPDRNKTPYILCQGKLGISKSFPAAGNISASCTISASEAAVGVAV